MFRPPHEKKEGQKSEQATKSRVPWEGTESVEFSTSTIFACFFRVWWNGIRAREFRTKL